MNLNEITFVNGLPEEERKILNELLGIWRRKLDNNLKRSDYYNARNKLKDLGISIPPPLRDVETVVGWPAKAVDCLAVRSRFDGFVCADGENDLLDRIVDGNNLKSAYAQAVNSELINSAVVATVSKGNEKGGEPPAIISFYSLVDSAVEWDRRHKRVKYGLTIIDSKRIDNTEEERPVWVNLYTDTAVWEIKRNDDGTWTSRKNPHNMGRPMLVALRYRPTLERPFGKSRISKAVRSITDSAVREALRSEVSAEFFTAPQKYLLGADDTVFDDESKWDAYIGTIFAVSKDEEGDIPHFGQLSQGSMQPHTEYMRTLAARFSGETAVPVSELGVVSDNPSSAEAIYAAKESLVIEAEHLNEINGDALKIVAKMALASAKGIALSDLDDNDRSVEPRFKNPARPSIVSQADAISKIIAALPWVAESEVPLEEFGFNEDQITRLRNDKRKAEAKSLILQQQQQSAQSEHTATMYEMSSILKSYVSGKITRKSAIALFAKIGIEEDEANQLLDDAEDNPDSVTDVIEQSPTADASEGVTIDADTGAGGANLL